MDIEANNINESGETALTNLLQKEYDKALQKYSQQPNKLSMSRKEVMYEDKVQFSEKSL